MIETDRLASRVLDTIPLLMRSIHKDMRRKDHHFEPNQFQILSMLAHHAHSVSALAVRQHVSLPSMSKTINALVERGWVERVPMPGDRRVVQIRLTEPGRESLQDTRRVMIDSVAGILANLTADERDKLSAGLDVLYDAFGMMHREQHCQQSPSGDEHAS
jgi:DNA-binding MarR family transcriptional regulator